MFVCVCVCVCVSVCERDTVCEEREDEILTDEQVSSNLVLLLFKRHGENVRDHSNNM